MYLWMKITCSIYKRLWVRSSNEHVEHIKQHVLTGTQHNNFISTKNYVIPSLVAMPHSLNVIPKQHQMANTISCSMSHHKFTSKGVHNKEPILSPLPPRSEKLQNESLIVTVKNVRNLWKHFKHYKLVPFSFIPFNSFNYSTGINSHFYWWKQNGWWFRILKNHAEIEINGDHKSSYCKTRNSFYLSLYIYKIVPTKEDDSHISLIVEHDFENKDWYFLSQIFSLKKFRFL